MAITITSSKGKKENENVEGENNGIIMCTYSALKWEAFFLIRCE